MASKTTETLLIVVFATLGAIFFAVAWTLLIKKYHKQIEKLFSKCLECFKFKKTEIRKNKYSLSYLGDLDAHVNLYVRSRTSSSRSSRRKRFRKTSAFSSHSFTSDCSSYPHEIFMDDDPDFTPPWTITEYQVQPSAKTELDWNYNRQVSTAFKPLYGQQPSSQSSPASLTWASAPKRVVRQRKFNSFASLHTSSDRSTHARLLQKAISVEDLPFDLEVINERSRSHSLDKHSDDYSRQAARDISLFRPELYGTSRRKTVGSGDLGKILFSLRYKDRFKKILNVTLHKIIELQPLRSSIQGVYVNIILLPERDIIFHSKLQSQVQASLKFEENFDFSSQPLDRDFEQKTIRFVLTYVEKSSKETTYGEARMPLLNSDIYSQIQTDRCVNIAPLSQKVSQRTLSWRSGYCYLNIG